MVHTGNLGCINLNDSLCPKMVWRYVKKKSSKVLCGCWKHDEPVTTRDFSLEEMACSLPNKPDKIVLQVIPLHLGRENSFYLIFNNCTSNTRGSLACDIRALRGPNCQNKKVMINIQFPWEDTRLITKDWDNSPTRMSNIKFTSFGWGSRSASV